jgi:outer membrane protein OmpA-like peptidoglycan-associated protein/opacity protein-like surface antigen
MLKNFNRLMAVIVFLISSFTIGYSQDFTLGLKGGGATYFGDVDDQQVHPYAGLSFGVWFAQRFAIGLQGYGAHLQAQKDGYYFENQVVGIAAYAKFRPLGKALVSPYLMGGIAGYQHDPKDGSGNPLPNNAAGSYEKERIGVPVGGGISFFLKENISLDLEGLYHFSMTDWLDDIAIGKHTDRYLTASLGLSFHFGKPKDTDGDGIVDKYDFDPLHAEDFDGFQDEDGAPDLDNDEDGILDRQDKAPLEPEDKDGFEDSDGVPDPDNDGDGIPDVDDAAPNEAEDVDNFQDKDGAPDPDNDQDNILDKNDQCPGTDSTVAEGIDTKETYNDYEDNDGCPDKKPEIAVEKGESIVLEGVYFSSGSANLTNNSKAVLDKVVRTLLENPKIEVEIRGYTDNTGNYENNIRLSQRRAEAVKIYLMNNRIDAARIRTQGFGPESPIAPNDTREGRAKNRRIEFFRVK